MSSQWRIHMICLHEGANSLRARERKPLWGLEAEPLSPTSCVDGGKAPAIADHCIFKSKRVALFR